MTELLKLTDDQLTEKTKVHTIHFEGEYKINSVYHEGVYVSYIMDTYFSDGDKTIMNKYRVICKIEGLHEGSAYLAFRMLDNLSDVNDATISNTYNIEELFENNSDIIGK